MMFYLPAMISTLEAINICFDGLQYNYKSSFVEDTSDL